jgi:uncharacterized protein Yka (UPF0111/DUF47 family)
MFSLQRFVVKDQRIFDLLEASAEQGHRSIENVVQLLTRQGASLDPFVEARRKEKHVTGEIQEYLVRTFVTPLDREDIEALSHALYRIPKTAEKFSERYLLAGPLVETTSFAEHLAMLDRAGELVVSLVKGLRGDLELSRAQAEHGELQRIEGEADKLMIRSLREVYGSVDAGLRAMVLKDLHELLEKIFDRCRDAGNAVFMVALKHS